MAVVAATQEARLCFFIAVAKNGEVCISILHEPGEDKYGYERPEERWLPIHTVETIMISVISMLADPNGDSPANVDAAVSCQSAKLRLLLWAVGGHSEQGSLLGRR